MHFNPRPREEGDLLQPQELQPQKGISIHALVKRATLCLLFFFKLDKISIHALVKRATWTKCDDNEYTRISIHALVKRATFLSGVVVPVFGFQSTPS